MSYKDPSQSVYKLVDIEKSKVTVNKYIDGKSVSSFVMFRAEPASNKHHFIDGYMESLTLTGDGQKFVFMSTSGIAAYNHAQLNKLPVDSDIGGQIEIGSCIKP